MRQSQASTSATIPIGRYGDNNSLRVIFDVTEWITALGSEGTWSALAVQPDESDPYIPTVITFNKDTNLVYWDLQDEELTETGTGKFELIYTGPNEYTALSGKPSDWDTNYSSYYYKLNGNYIPNTAADWDSTKQYYSVSNFKAFSPIYTTNILESLDGDSTVPTPYESFYAKLININDNVNGKYVEIMEFIPTYDAKLSTLQDIVDTMAANLITESTTRASADSSLREAIDALVSPSGQSVVVDKSLSISGAAADAKTTGDKFKSLGLSVVDGQLCVTYNV